MTSLSHLNKIVSPRNKRIAKLFYKDININFKKKFQFKLITSCSKWTGPYNYNDNAANVKIRPSLREAWPAAIRAQSCSSELFFLCESSKTTP